MTKRPKILTLADLIAGMAVSEEQRPAGVLPHIEISGAVIDSRLASPGSLFIAMPGERLDGHDFIPQAISNGAIVVITEHIPARVECQAIDLSTAGPEVSVEATLPICLCVPDSLAALQRVAHYWRRRHDVRVIGITGSIGKTTSKEVISAVLSQRYCMLKSEGNYNNEIGLPLTLLHLTNQHERVVLEMGMYDVGEIAQLADIAVPQVGVVTNVGPSHLERLGTIERIAQAKAELPQALPPAEEGGVAILNADDERVRAMSALTRARIFTYGLAPEAELRANDIESQGLAGIRLRFHLGAATMHTHLPMLGRHSVHTALRGAATGLVEGLEWDEIMLGLRDQSAQIRLLAVPGPAGSTILDDTYNASPASSVAALNMLDELGLEKRRALKIAVLGDMYELGQYEEEGHKLVGRRARDAANILITVGPLGSIIGQEALESGMPAEEVHSVETNSQAIDLLQSLLAPRPGGDIILIKGSRGMQMEEIVAALQEGGRL